MDIYSIGNRLLMVIEAHETFSFEAKANADLANPIVQESETLMGRYQAASPLAKPGEKWVLMDHTFSLTS